MSQQAQNDFYPSEEEAAMDYAAAVNAEIRGTLCCRRRRGAIDEPYMQARPEKARQYGLKALNRALEGITGRRRCHICFGYAAVIHARAAGVFDSCRSCMGCCAMQISLETAQSNLDTKVLAELENKKIILGVINLTT